VTGPSLVTTQENVTQLTEIRGGGGRGGGGGGKREGRERGRVVGRENGEERVEEKGRREEKPALVICITRVRGISLSQTPGKAKPVAKNQRGGERKGEAGWYVKPI